jgi:hypothetical protein
VYAADHSTVAYSTLQSYRWHLEECVHCFPACAITFHVGRRPHPPHALACGLPALFYIQVKICRYSYLPYPHQDRTYLFDCCERQYMVQDRDGCQQSGARDIGQRSSNEKPDARGRVLL